MGTIDKYIPSPVPFGIGSGELRRYLDNELYRIAEQLSLLTQLSAHGGLLQIGGQALAVTATPQKLPFTSALPGRDMDTDLATDEVIIEEDGDYIVSFFTNSAASNSILLTFEPYINDIPSGRPGYSEIITQANGQIFAASSLVTLPAGARVSMYVSGDANRTVTFLNVNFYLVRV